MRVAPDHRKSLRRGDKDALIEQIFIPPPKNNISCTFAIFGCLFGRQRCLPATREDNDQPRLC